MAIKKKTLYSIICDTCKEDLLHGSEITSCDSIEAVRAVAADNCWLDTGDRHYCRDCTACDSIGEYRPRKTDTVFALKKGLNWSMSGPHYGVKVNTQQDDVCYVVIYDEPFSFSP